MRRQLFKLLMPTLVVLGLLLSGVVPAIASPGNAPGRYIVVMKPGVDTSAVAREHGVAVAHSYTHALKGFAAPLSPAQLQALATDPRVAYVEPDLVVHICEQTLPTGVNRIDADLNATANIDGKDDRVDVDIAIIDTGIDKDHPDLNVVGGRHFYTVNTGPPWDRGTNEDDNYDDDNGHGSHVAGSAAALDNDAGVVGVAPGAKLWGVKVLDASGSGYLSDVIAGIDWVTGKADTIEVANMSLIWQGNSSAAREAIQNSVGVGVVYVVAAGNDAEDVYGPDGNFGTSDDFEPAAYPEVSTISAMADSDGQPGGDGGSTSYGADDSFASFSNFSASVWGDNPVTSPGAAIDLLMPGVDIYSTYKDGGYATSSGTSMASPHGAGLAALYIAVNGRASNATQVHAIRQALIDGGVAQGSDQGLATLNDNDGNRENIGWAGTPGDLPPSVSIVSPTEGSTVSGTVKVEIYATDTEDVVGTLTVEWNVDGGAWQSATYNSSNDYYEASWDSTTVGDGEHTITATATDTIGQKASDSISVTVDNNNDSPVADAGPDQTVVDEDGDGFISVTLDASGGGPIAFDASSSASTDPDSDTLSWSHTTSGSDRIMIVGVTTRSNTPVTSLTYGGMSLTKIRHDNPGIDVRTELWYLIAPNEGTHTVSLTTEKDTTIEAGATTWTGVEQTAALGNDAGAMGLGSIASVDVVSASGEVVVDVVGTQNAGATVTVGPGQTERWNQVGTAGVGAASSEPGATTVTMSWDLAMDESWAISAVALLSAGGSYDPDGTIESYKWEEGTEFLGTTASITTDFSSGTMHTVTLTVTDDGGATATDTVVVTVETPSDTPPTMSITSPADGATVSGIIDVTADATDDKGVTQVEFFVDGVSIGVDTDGSDGWSTSWNTTTVADGSHTLTATATDAIGQTVSDSISVTVDNADDPPSVAITSPVNGATVSGTIEMTADAIDDKGVTKVEFFVDGTTKIGEDTTAPYAVSWDTTTVTDGGHTVTATATDTIGQTASDSISVTVDNTAPTVSITSPADGATVFGTIDVTADASDATSGVAQVEFFVGDASIGVDTDGSDSWSISWDTTTVDNGSYTLTATATDAAGNAITSDPVVVTVDNPEATTMHVGDLDGSADLKGTSGRWEVFVTVTIHDENHNPVANATVTGEWSGAMIGTVSGTTGSDGTVTLSTGNMSGGFSVTFTVTDVTHDILTYDATNHDPDDDSDGTSITISKQ